MCPASDMGTRARLCSVVIFLSVCLRDCHGLRCYTCTVDFRSQPFDLNNTCLFPRNNDDLVHCSSGSKFCKATITRVNGIFVMLARTCSSDCLQYCTEKGYGIKIKECTKCCTKEAICGTQELMTNKNIKPEDRYKKRDDKKTNGASGKSFSWSALHWTLVVIMIIAH